MYAKDIPGIKDTKSDQVRPKGGKKISNRA